VVCFDKFFSEVKIFLKSKIEKKKRDLKIEKSGFQAAN
jgi:hypothetical protein